MLASKGYRLVGLEYKRKNRLWTLKVAIGCHRSSQVATGCHKLSQVVTSAHMQSQVIKGCHRSSQAITDHDKVSQFIMSHHKLSNIVTLIQYGRRYNVCSIENITERPSSAKLGLGLSLAMYTLLY